MKKLIALILLTIFIGSSVVKLYKDFTTEDAISISILENEDDNSKKEIEKDVKKDKLTIPIITVSLLNLFNSQKFYITHSYFLPNPTLAKDIIPPNAA